MNFQGEGHTKGSAAVGFSNAEQAVFLYFNAIP